MEKAAHETLPKRNRPQPGWFKQNEVRLKSLTKKRNSALSLKSSRPTRSSSQRLRKIGKELKSAINKAKNKWITTTCDKLNKYASSRKGTKECWDTVTILKKGLHKPETSNEKMMRKEGSTRCKSSEENAQFFKEHFKKLYEHVSICDRSVLELLQQEPVISGVDHPPTNKEILKSGNSLKNNAPGESELTSQMFKAIVSNNQTLQLLRSITLDFWENELPPDQWEAGLLKIFPKKCDLSQPGNYRGITLLEVAYKIIANIFHSRLVPIAEKLDHKSQSEFRPGRNFADAVFTVKLPIKKNVENTVTKLG